MTNIFWVTGDLFEETACATIEARKSQYSAFLESIDNEELRQRVAWSSEENANDTLAEEPSACWFQAALLTAEYCVDCAEDMYPHLFTTKDFDKGLARTLLAQIGEYVFIGVLDTNAKAERVTGLHNAGIINYDMATGTARLKNTPQAISYITGLKG